jgi:hypothetical protein
MFKNVLPPIGNNCQKLSTKEELLLCKFDGTSNRSAVFSDHFCKGR